MSDFVFAFLFFRISDQVQLKLRMARILKFQINLFVSGIYTFYTEKSIEG